MEEKRKKRFTKREWSWIMYDWANSVYATNIMAAIFPTIFVSIAGSAGTSGGATPLQPPRSLSPSSPR